MLSTTRGWFIVFLLVTAACDRGAASSGASQVGSSPDARSMPMAPGAPLNLAKPDEVRIRLDLVQARSALRSHQMTSGGFPQTLSELGLKLSYPTDLTYDAASGTVRSRTYPAL